MEEDSGWIYLTFKFLGSTFGKCRPDDDGNIQCHIHPLNESMSIPYEFEDDGETPPPFVRIKVSDLKYVKIKDQHRGIKPLFDDHLNVFFFHDPTYESIRQEYGFCSITKGDIDAFLSEGAESKRIIIDIQDSRQNQGTVLLVMRKFDPRFVAVNNQEFDDPQTGTKCFPIKNPLSEKEKEYIICSKNAYSGYRIRHRFMEDVKNFTLNLASGEVPSSFYRVGLLAGEHFKRRMNNGIKVDPMDPYVRKIAKLVVTCHDYALEKNHGKKNVPDENDTREKVRMLCYTLTQFPTSYDYSPDFIIDDDLNVPKTSDYAGESSVKGSGDCEDSTRFILWFKCWMYLLSEVMNEIPEISHREDVKSMLRFSTHYIGVSCLTGSSSKSIFPSNDGENSDLTVAERSLRRGPSDEKTHSGVTLTEEEKYNAISAHDFALMIPVEDVSEAIQGGCIGTPFDSSPLVVSGILPIKRAWEKLRPFPCEGTGLVEPNCDKFYSPVDVERVVIYPPVKYLNQEQVFDPKTPKTSFYKFIVSIMAAELLLRSKCNTVEFYMNPKGSHSDVGVLWPEITRRSFVNYTLTPFSGKKSAAASLIEKDFEGKYCFIDRDFWLDALKKLRECIPPRMIDLPYSFSRETVRRKIEIELLKFNTNPPRMVKGFRTVDPKKWMFKSNYTITFDRWRGLYDTKKLQRYLENNHHVMFSYFIMDTFIDKFNNDVKGIILLKMYHRK